MLNDDISFEEAMDIVSNKLANLGTNIKDSKAYDGMIVKRLASSNTLDEKQQAISYCYNRRANVDFSSFASR